MSLFNARFPSSLQTCQLRFQVQKLGVNFATKFASTFQCLNYCKQMFVVQVEINNSMESSWSRGATKKICIWLNWLLLSSMNICLQTKFKHWNVLTNFVAKFARSISELGNRALKSDLKSTLRGVRLTVRSRGQESRIISRSFCTVEDWDWLRPSAHVNDTTIHPGRCEHFTSRNGPFPN